MEAYCHDDEDRARQLSMSEMDLSRPTVDTLLQRALSTADVGADLDSGYLQDIFEALSPRRPQLEIELEEDGKRQKLLEWMERKKAEQMRKYRQELEDKRSSEAHPFQPKGMLLSQKMVEFNNEERLAKKRQMQLQNIELRSQDVAHLLGEMLSDHPPLATPSIRQTSKVADDKTSTRSRPITADSSRSARMMLRSPRKQKFPTEDYNEYLKLLSSCEREAEMILRGDDKEFGSARTTARKEVRQKQLVYGDVGGGAVEKENKFASANKTYKLKSFRDVVKLQRPEATRQKRPHVTPSSSSLLSSKIPSTGEELSPEEKQKIYGSSRIPRPQQNRPTVRTIKTYAQRLQEMKQHPAGRTGNQISWRHTSSPAAGTHRSNSGGAEIHRNQKRRTKPRQTLTYSQQLQRLQPPKEQYHPAPVSLPVRPATGLHWHKPFHHSKTYAEQLHELQQPATVRLENRRPWTAGPMRPLQQPAVPFPRSQHRSRPYANPYSDVEASTDLSVWSIDDDVHNILYGDDPSQSPHFAASDTDLSELIALRDGDIMPYTDMVAVEDLEMFDSVSIASILDWEEIDRMVADIQ